MNTISNSMFVLLASVVIFFLWPGDGGRLGAAPGTVKITYPNGGEVLKAGSQVAVKWQSKGLRTNDNMVIILFKKGIKHSIISKKAPNSGRFNWRVPPRLPKGRDYRIRIRVLKNLSVNDFSDRNFTIAR
ncbi:MAG: hypothetical protein GY940_14340 [bacterium]|nr:hypothetical protein [bacterium]